LAQASNGRALPCRFEQRPIAETPENDKSVQNRKVNPYSGELSIIVCAGKSARDFAETLPHRTCVSLCLDSFWRWARDGRKYYGY
jgi:hypothetical protein